MESGVTAANHIFDECGEHNENEVDPNSNENINVPTSGNHCNNKLQRQPISPTPPSSIADYQGEENVLAEPKEKRASLDENDGCYGELILLGYNGGSEAPHQRSGSSCQQAAKKHRSKMVLKRREGGAGNGVKKGRVVETNQPPKQSQVVQDSSRHVVSYTYRRNHTVLVEYVPDPTTDMFQVGRSSDEQIDFTIVDTWLATGSPSHHHSNQQHPPHAPRVADESMAVLSALSEKHHAAGYRGNTGAAGPAPHREPRLEVDPGQRQFIQHPTVEKTISSTISRYACRILADRHFPDNVYVYAAGFDSSRNIFLGEKATKWQKKNGEYDGFTTNGVLILHPNSCASSGNVQEKTGDAPSEALSLSLNDQPQTTPRIVGTPSSTACWSQTNSNTMCVWREVTVDGDIYSLRETRSSSTPGGRLGDESNQLQDGTLIDLCGATLLWRSAAGLRQSPSLHELERRLDELNAGKPQCPVNLNTLVMPRRRSLKSTHSPRQPYAYLRCGHVQGRHSWGVVHTKPAAANAAGSSSTNGHVSLANNRGGSVNSPAGGYNVAHGAVAATVFRCPICMIDSERVFQLTMGMEPAFHLDNGQLDHAFNPCGHVASAATVRYWSKIPLPHGTSSFHPCCPFCTSLLADPPFIRLIFQDHCDSS